MKTHPLWTALCITIAPWAAASQGAAAVEQVRAQDRQAAAPAAPVLGFSNLNVRASDGQKGMIGIYLAEDENRARVEGLVSGGPAEQAGLKAGDRIVSIDGAEVGGWRELGALVGAHRAGERVKVTVERDGWRRDFELTLAAAPDAPQGAAEAPSQVIQKLKQKEKEKEKPKQQKADAKESKGFFEVHTDSQPKVLRLQELKQDAMVDELRGRVLELHSDVVKKKAGGAESEDCCAPGSSCCPGGAGCCAPGYSLNTGGLKSPLRLEKLGGGTLKIHGEDGDRQVLVLPRTDGGSEHEVVEIEVDGGGGFVWRSQGGEAGRGGTKGTVGRLHGHTDEDEGGHGLHFFHDGDWQVLHGGTVPGGADGPNVYRFRVGGQDGPSAGGGAGPARGRDDLSQLRDELENLREELRQLRQALRQVRGGGER